MRRIVCRRCQQERNHQARGLCQPCWVWASNNDALIDYERTLRTSAEIIEEAELLASAGVGAAEAVARLGYKARGENGLAKALRRAGRTDLWNRLQQQTRAIVRTHGKVA